MFATTNENNPAVYKLLLGGKLGEKHVTVKQVPLTDRSLHDPKHLPYLTVNDNSIIFVPNAALWYLFPPPDQQAEQSNEWLEWESTALAPTVTVLIGKSSKNEKLKSHLLGLIKKLNSALENRVYLINDTISCADVAIWATLYPLTCDPNLLNEHLGSCPNVTKWINCISKSGPVQEVLAAYKISCAPSVAYEALMSGAKYVNLVPSEPRALAQQQVDSVTPEELEQAEKAWLKDRIERRVKATAKEVLPNAKGKNIFITSALPYVNNVPHLGNIIGCVLSSDVFARFCRVCNYNTLFIAGTDEYGTATETKALEEGMSCRAICDKYYAIHKDIYDWFNIGFDHFGRTSTPQQTELCQDMFLQLNNNGFMFTEPVEQLHCEKCNRFLADRFVEGGCPHPGCNYEDARGDQCDGCGKLVNAVELKNPRCKICRDAPKLKTSHQFFLDLPKLEPLLLHWMKQSSPGWSNNAQIIGRTWMKEGLKPRCITRDLKWGVPVPLEQFKTKVFYVWFDAPIGYMSITKAYTDKWEQWWRPQKDVQITMYQFMAKDNVPFHSVMFPACLLGANRGYVTVSHIMATEYLNYEDGKFSKSRGVGVFGNDARDTGIPSDVWRFYLLYVRPESQDSSFSWADLATKNNSELLNNLGNFINRALVFAKNNFGGAVPEIRADAEDFELLALCTRELRSYVESLKKAKLRDGIRFILAMSRHGNQYMQTNQPWVLLKGSAEEKLRAGTVIGICCNIACLLATLLHPYMPDTSDKLKNQLNIELTPLDPENVEITCLLPTGHKLGEPAPLFVKLEPSVVEDLKKKFAGQQNGNSKVNGVPQSCGAAEIEAEVAKQADKVRVLKSSGADKKIWQPEVAILLSLKKKLEEALKVPKPVAPSGNNKINAADIEAEIAKQADKVRLLKSGGADKKVWQPEVAILLSLKKKLEEATKTPVGVANSNQINSAGDADLIKRLEKEMTDQGLVVRKLKEGGADKSVWQPEVTKLLELKSKLTTASGVPEQKVKNSKKK